MIRKSVRLSGICLREPEQRRVYSLHYCGLCHALGEHYGLSYRLFTSHELTLLNLLTTAQSPKEPDVRYKRCPLNPVNNKPGNHNASSEFAAAAAISLASVKFADDLRDSRGRSVVAKWACRSLQPAFQHALGVLGYYGFDPSDLKNLDERQARVEQDDAAYPAGPSAQTSAGLFDLSSHLAGMPRNASVLGEAGACFGEFIYIRDALEDLSQDIAHRQFNPLRRFCRPVTGGVLLAREGIDWVPFRLDMLLRNLRSALTQVTFQRYGTLIPVLLVQPVEGALRSLTRFAPNSDSLYLRIWQPVDVLRSGLFLEPETLIDPGQAVFPISENPFDQEEKRRRSCSTCTGRDAGGSDWLYCGHGNCGGADCGSFDCRDIDCGALDCSGVDWCRDVFSGCGGCTDRIDCSSMDCSHVDCGGADCSGADCSGADCGGADCSG